jgi:hypothetical protein
MKAKLTPTPQTDKSDLLNQMAEKANDSNKQKTEAYIVWLQFEHQCLRNSDSPIINLNKTA